MKRIITFSVTLIITTFLLSACTRAQEPSTEEGAQWKRKKVLIVYLSRTKNTKTVAEIIQKNVQGTLTAVELKKPYPIDYKTTVEQVARENETGYLPPLKTRIADIEKYDVVFVGFPTWGMQLPPPMKSFLHQYDLSGKTVIPFNTNAGYGIGSSFETVKQLCPESKVLEGFSIKGGVERDGVLFVLEGEKYKQAQTKVENWLKTLSKSFLR